MLYDDPNMISMYLQSAIQDFFEIHQIGKNEGTILFQGRLLMDSAHAYSLAEQRFKEYNYTPLLRRENGIDMLYAMPGLITPRPIKIRTNIILLILTILSTIWAGSHLYETNSWQESLQLGLLFAASLLAILGIHEMGHYLTGRHHKVDVTPPYFIPVPFGLGTFGAFIQMRSPTKNKRALFDVAVAGPFAGFLVALPLLIIGLLLSPLVPYSGRELSTSLLVSGLEHLLRPHPAGYAVSLHPVALAAYVGMWVTAMNLIPGGQLDGGHLMYAIAGKWTRWINMVIIGIMVILGAVAWSGWYIWGFFILLSGLNHPPPLDEVTRLDGKRTVVAILALVVFALTFSPSIF